MRSLLVLVFLAFVVGWPASVAAQPADVPGLIKLIENQPNDMDRSTWKEKRRDAARRLAQSKDKRGVPVLIRLAESETFDIVGEIAIEGLGSLGDQSAVPVLQSIVADTSRDKTSRDLARKALAKLGASETGGGATTVPTTTPTTTTTTTATGGGAKTGGGGAKTGGGGAKTGGGATTTTTTPTATTSTTTTTTNAAPTGGTGTTTTAGTGTTVATGDTGLETGGGLGDTGTGLLGESRATTIEGAPDFQDDVIAATNRLTFAIGSVGLRMVKLPADDAPPYQTPDRRLDFDADVAASYLRRVDTETKAYAVGVDADLVTGMVNPEGSASTRAALFNLQGTGEARFYSNQLYGIGKAAVGFGMQYLALTTVDGGGTETTNKDTQTQFDLAIAIGGGFGRLVDVGGAIRVRRLARLLDSARALGKPIDAATSKRLQATWWALRRERSSIRALLATIAVLREAGVLLGEPNAVITYEILTVLRDTQLFMRPEGFDTQLVIAEAYLQRPDDENNPDQCDLASCGRVEQVIATVGYGMQMDEDKMEVSASGYARYRLFAPDDPATPTPVALGGGARMRRFTYGEHGDPFGALDVAGRLAFSTDGFSMDPFGFDSDNAVRFEADAGFTYWLNPASGIRLSANLVVDQSTYFLGARLEGTYGLLDAVYAR